VAIVSVERRQDRVLAPNEIGESIVDAFPAGGGDLYAYGSSVRGVLTSSHEAALFESIQTIGHRARGHERLGEQLSR